MVQTKTMLPIIATLFASITTISAQLTGAQKTYILDEHNDRRATVAAGNQQGRSMKYPRAEGNMPDLIWDLTLAELAQDFAEECGPTAHEPASVLNAKYKKIYDRNPYRARFDYKYDGVGENIAGNCPYTKAVTRFFDHEARWWDYANGYKTPTYCKKGATNNKNPVCGHLTQVIWQDTKYVGCGWSKCGNNGKLVCNYYPAGNVRDEYPYDCDQPGVRGCPEPLTGTCCECMSGPPSKALCNNQCENAVANKDSWCGKAANNWDQTCRNFANNLCKAANAFENSCDFETDAVCVDGLSLFGDETEGGETKEFAVHEDSDCNDNGWTLYHHAPSAFANYYIKYFEETRNASATGWKITEQLLEYNANISWWADETTIATCYEEDLMACVETVWSGNDETVSAYQCASDEAVQSVSNAPIIAVSLIALVLVVAAIGIGFYFCIYRKNKVNGKGVSTSHNSETVGIRDDDAMANKHQTMNGTETIDVEVEA